MSWINKPAIAGLSLYGALLGYTCYGAYQDFFVADSRVVSYLDVAKKSLDSLAANVGGVNRMDGVITVITTNRIESIDEAAQRYGRLGIHYRIEVPNYEGRKEIARIHVNRIGRQDLVDDFDYDRFANKTDGLTGADIAGIVNQTFVDRYKAIKLNGVKPFQLSTDDFLKTAAR